ALSVEFGGRLPGLDIIYTRIYTCTLPGRVGPLPPFMSERCTTTRRKSLSKDGRGHKRPPRYNTLWSGSASACSARTKTREPSTLLTLGRDESAAEQQQ